MRCGYIFPNPPHVPRRACGQETERRCSHCASPVCAEHSIKMGDEFVCLTAAAERARDRYAALENVW